MNKQVYQFIAREEGVTVQEAKEMWNEELEENGHDIEEALYSFGIEIDMVC